MQVKDLMQREVFTVDQNDLIDRAFFLMHYEKIRHLPVMEKSRVVGIVSDRDMYKALGPKSGKGAVTHTGDKTALYVIPRKIRHIMRRGVITIHPDAAVSKAASMMASKKIGALPVVKNDRLVGIITAVDLLREFAKMSRQAAR